MSFFTFYFQLISAKNCLSKYYNRIIKAMCSHYEMSYYMIRFSVLINYLGRPFLTHYGITWYLKLGYVSPYQIFQGTI